MKTLIDQLKAARACSTPLLAVTTPDQPAVARAIADALNGDNPVVSWDRTNGFTAPTKRGVSALEEFCGKAGISVDELSFATCEAHNAFRLAVHLKPQTL